MEPSGALASTRKARLRSESQDPFDLRTPFLVELRLLPALLLLVVLTTFAAMGAGADALALGWLALSAVNAAVRFLIATTHSDAKYPVIAESTAGRAYLATALADLALWAAMMAVVPKPAIFLAGSGGFAAAGAVLLASLSYGGWPRVWTFYVAAWVGVFAIGARSKRRLRVPVFWERPDALVLPAFGSFTGGHRISREHGGPLPVSLTRRPGRSACRRR